MSALRSLHERLDDADAALRAVRRLERAHRNLPRSTPADIRSTYSIRASVFVMIYNAVESSMRAVFGSLRATIQAEGVHFRQAKEFWQFDFIQSTFLERMQSGTNHGNLLIEMVPTVDTNLSWNPNKMTEITASGNIGQSAAISIVKRLGVVWTPPRNCGGGSDLEIVRVNRNALAHGLDTFDSIGRSTTTQDMFTVVDRTRRFMESLIQVIEDYESARSYVR